jgi:hypothetical protein
VLDKGSHLYNIKNELAITLVFCLILLRYLGYMALTNHSRVTLISVSAVGAGGSILVMLPTIRCLQILAVDPALVNMENMLPSVAGLAGVTGTIHVFIMFSQSEHSSSAKAERNRVKKD